MSGTARTSGASATASSPAVRTPTTGASSTSDNRRGPFPVDRVSPRKTPRKGASDETHPPARGARGSRPSTPAGRHERKPSHDHRSAERLAARGDRDQGQHF